MKSIYIAAPWARRAEARELAKQLPESYRLTRAWWNEEAADDAHKRLGDHARNDLLAVLGCDIFILLNLEKSEGKAVETGVALARLADSPQYGLTYRPRLIGCGPRYSNIFHNLPCWEWYETPAQLLEAL